MRGMLMCFALQDLGPHPQAAPGKLHWSSLVICKRGHIAGEKLSNPICSKDTLLVWWCPLFDGQFRNFDLRDLLLWLWAQRCHECRVHCKQSSLLSFHSLSHLCSQQVSQLSSFQLAINPRSNEHPFKQHPSTHFSKVILLCFAGYCSLTSEAEKSFQKWQAI